MNLKQICASLRKKKVDAEGRSNVQLASLMLFFNTFLRKKAINDAQWNDRLVHRFFGDWSSNQHAKLKDLFHQFVSNDKVMLELNQYLLSLGATMEQIELIVNPLYVSYLRILCIPKTHIIDTALFRDTMFKILVERGNLRADVATTFLNLDTLEVYKEAFTHLCASYGKNYEVWETVGDGVAKGLLRFYVIRRFPELLTSPGSSEVITQIGQIYESKGYFYKLFDYLGFENICSYKEELVYIAPKQAEDKVYGDFVLIHLDKSMKEDMFEAFLGVTQYLVDAKIQLGMGNAVCYNIFSSLYDEQEIETDITKTKDARSRINEIFNASPLVYEHTPGKSLDKFIFYENQIEKGTGLHTGLVRMKLEFTFLPDPQKRRRNIVKAFEITQLTKEVLWSDWLPTPPEAKENVAMKGIKLLEDKYKVFWKRGQTETSLEMYNDNQE